MREAEWPLVLLLVMVNLGLELSESFYCCDVRAHVVLLFLAMSVSISLARERASTYNTR